MLYELDEDSENLFTEIVSKFIGELYDRQGFDSWWDSIDADVQSEIIGDLRKIVADIVFK
jgi:hypothetical protein